MKNVVSYRNEREKKEGRKGKSIGMEKKGTINV